jgi:hypothetical protein
MKIDLTKEEWAYILLLLRWSTYDKYALKASPWLIPKKFDKLLEKFSSKWKKDEHKIDKR